jgi:hypothetical protein
LTRASIHLQKSLAKEMDCRVKPGKDGNGRRPGQASIASASRDPFAVSPLFKQGACGLSFVSLETPGVMGPGVRRDDVDICF